MNVLERLADLHTRWRDILVRYAYWQVNDWDEAEDIVADALARAAEAWSAKRTEDETVWLRVIVANACKDWRKDIRRQSVPYEDAVEARERTDAEVESAELRAVLSDAFSGIPERTRTIVLLHLVDNVPHETLAVRFGMTVGASKMLVMRTRKRLQRALASYMGAAPTVPPRTHALVRRPVSVVSEQFRILFHFYTAWQEPEPAAKCHANRRPVRRGLCRDCYLLDAQLERESLPPEVSLCVPSCC